MDVDAVPSGSAPPELEPAMDVDAVPSRSAPPELEPAVAWPQAKVSRQEASEFLWADARHVLMANAVQREHPGITAHQAVGFLILRHRAAVKVQRAFRAWRGPWPQKVVSLDEATGFLMGHPERVTLVMAIWTDSGAFSIGRATEILVLRHRAKAKVHAELLRAVEARTKALEGRG